MIRGVLATIGIVAGGSGLMLLTSPTLPRVARLTMAAPMGFAAYLTAALVETVTTGSMTPTIALSVTVGAGAIGALTAKRALSHRWRDLAMATAIGSTVALVTNLVALSILSPDSVRYVLFGSYLLQPDGLDLVHRADLFNRMIGFPAMLTIGSFGGEMYSPALGPLFGFSTLGLFAWVLTRGARPRCEQYEQIVLFAVAAVFLLSTNRFLYSWTYLNSHIQVAFYVLLAVAGLWVLQEEKDSGWALPVGMSLAAVTLLRPEGALVTTIILALAAAIEMRPRVRVAVTMPSIVAVVLWHGVALLGTAFYQARWMLVVPNVIGILTTSVLILTQDVRFIRPVTRHSHRLVLGGLILGLLGMSAMQWGVMRLSLNATLSNVVEGGWLLTWVALTPLVFWALLRSGDRVRIWASSTAALGITYWLLPLLRGGAYRPGTGDSGNRFLIHLVAVAVAFVALTALSAGQDPVGEVPER